MRVIIQNTTIPSFASLTLVEQWSLSSLSSSYLWSVFAEIEYFWFWKWIKKNQGNKEILEICFNWNILFILLNDCSIYKSHIENILLKIKRWSILMKYFCLMYAKIIVHGDSLDFIRLQLQFGRVFYWSPIFTTQSQLYLHKP
jgi:hypothetical protein